MSNKTKHTPGPWFAVGNEIHDKATRFDPDSGARIGATASRICMTEYPYGDDGGKAANARLIAAAPELLEALESMNEAFRVDQTTFTTAQVSAIRAMDAAIAKAK